MPVNPQGQIVDERGNVLGAKTPVDSYTASLYAGAANAYDFGYARTPAQIASAPITSATTAPQTAITVPPATVPTNTGQPSVANGQAVISSFGTQTTAPQQLDAFSQALEKYFPKAADPTALYTETYGLTPEQALQRQQQAEQDAIQRRSRLRAAQAEFEGTKAEIQQIIDTSKAALLEETGGKSITAGVYNAKAAEADRRAALQVLPLQSKALIQQANIATLSGQVQDAQDVYKLAQDKLDKVFELKKDYAKDVSNRQEKMLSLIIPYATELERRQIADAKDRNDKNFSLLNGAIDEASDIRKAAAANGQGEIAIEIGQLVPPELTSPTFAEDLKIYRQKVATLQGKITKKAEYFIADENGLTVQYKKDASGAVVPGSRTVLGGTSKPPVQSSVGLFTPTIQAAIDEGATAEQAVQAAQQVASLQGITIPFDELGNLLAVAKGLKKVEKAVEPEPEKKKGLFEKIFGKPAEKQPTASSTVPAIPNFMEGYQSPFGFFNNLFGG